MKTKVYVLIICCMLVYGCGKTNCSGYAPEGGEISWTDYNSVNKVLNYFKYKHTADQHSTDTVLMCGYIIGTEDTDYYRSIYENAGGELCIYMTDDPQDRYNGRARGGKLSIPLHGRKEEMEWLKDYKAGQRVRVKGFCYATDSETDGGCFWIVRYYVKYANINTRCRSSRLCADGTPSATPASERSLHQ